MDHKALADVLGVLVVGEALVDVVGRDDGEPAEHPGGSPLNVAVGLARLGVASTLATQLGDDGYGDLVHEHLLASDVEIDDLSPTPERTSTAVAALGIDGAAVYEFDLTWNPDSLPDPDGFAALHVGSLGSVLAPGARLVTQIVARAHAVGVPVSFDANVRLTVEPDAARWREVFDTLAPAATVLRMSQDDVDVLFPGHGATALAAELASERRLVAITQGPDGAVLAAADHVVAVEAPSVDVVDTIGAGDSFTAALLAGLATRGWATASTLSADDLRDLGTQAAHAAALTCTRPGAT